MSFPSFKNKRWILLVVLCVYYLSFLAVCGVIICGDSFYFQTGSVRVSPVYPIVISLFRAIFSESGYEYPLIIFQELIMAYAVFSFTDALEKTTGTGRVIRWLTAGLIAFFFYAFRVILIGRDTDTVFCNAILSEGIAYPLYLFVVKYLFLALQEKKAGFLIPATVFTFLLTSTRGQMYWLLIALLIVFLTVTRGRSLRVRAKALIAAGLFVFCTFALSIGYHYFRSGSVTSTTQASETFLTTVLYESAPEDIEKLDIGDMEKGILTDTLEYSKSNGWLSDSAPSDLIGAYRHYEDSFDRIRIYFLERVASCYGYHDDTDTPGELLSMVCGACSKAIPDLVGEHFGSYIRTRAINLIAGIVRSNSIFSKPGFIWSAFLYLVSIAILIVYGKGSRMVFLKLCLLLILLNSVFVSLGVFALSRYMYYNFPLHYAALLLSCYGIIGKRKGKQLSV